MEHNQTQLQLAVLQHRIERTEAFLILLRKVEGRFPWIRLGVLAVMLLVIYLAFQLLSLAAAWGITMISMLGFAAAAFCHQAVIDKIARLEGFQRLLKTNVARLQLDWENIPPATSFNTPLEHPFAADLNVVGERSLHQFIDTSFSLGGSHRLADWMLQTTPDPQQITHRQQLVRELIERPAFRNRLQLNGMLANPGGQERWDGSALLKWLEARRGADSLRPRLILLSALAVINWILFGMSTVGLLPPLWIASLLIYFAVQSLKFRETSEVFDEAYSLARQLGQLRIILLDLENYPYQSAQRLAALTAPLSRGIRPSVALLRISRIVSAASLRNNPFFSVILNVLVPWDLFFAYQLERYKHDLHECLPPWLETWYELEGLCALATFAVLNPETTFPEMLPANSRPIFECVEIGHPLILDSTRVSNDFSIHTPGEITVITGSNMSGKSTFLRTVGANLVLAFAGGTVCARQLRTIPFRLYASMNINDSLNDGISFFYAEVRRLKTLLNQLEADVPEPMFFLIDEIFRGTNNRERQEGSHAYTKALAGKRGAGLISTHDLELAQLANQIPQVHNQHFREEIRDRKMVFDYKIRPGSSPTTNALKIMALAGLPVPDSVEIP